MVIEAVAAEGFKLALTELHEYLKKKSSIFSKKINLDIDNAYLKASKVEEVKTIWQVDRVVNLNEFYHPSKINVESNRIEIGSLKDLPENGKIVIQGTAGQGKSIFLRYLTGNELKHGTKIPIFVELRKITDRKSIGDLVIASLSNLGIVCDSLTLNYIFGSGKCTLILDAFDEVKESQVLDTISYLEDLCDSFHELQIIISSRPNSDIQCVTFFRVYDLCPLIPSDFPSILNKFFHNDQSTKVDDIVKAIHNNGAGIANLITTPLLLTLLTITYKSYHRIPEKLHEFYDNLFYLLVNRQDSTKPGFSREFKSELNETQLEDLFCAFCFHCAIDRKETLTHKEAISLIKKGKTITCLDRANETGFLEDTKNNTCLIIEEGLEYHFIHKSIMEYHAASFIAKSPEELKKKFYALAISEPRQFSQEIEYLKNVDSYYCDKLFLKPVYESLFEALGASDGEVDLDALLKGLSITVNKGLFSGIVWDNKAINRNRYFSLNYSVVQHLCRWDAPRKTHPKNYIKSYVDVYDSHYVERLKEHLKEYIERLRSEYKDVVDRLEQQEKAIRSIDF